MRTLTANCGDAKTGSDDVPGIRPREPQKNVGPTLANEDIILGAA